MRFLFTAEDHAGFSAKVTTSALTVDTSPPIVGQFMLNYKLDTKYVNINKLNIRPFGFLDKESGIKKYDITVGTSHHAADIVSSLTFTDDIDLDLPDDVMNNGHQYYVNLKVIRISILPFVCYI